MYKRTSPLNRKTLTEEQRLNLYEFEVDENEPQAPKKKRRKRIVKKYPKKANSEENLIQAYEQKVVKLKSVNACHLNDENLTKVVKKLNEGKKPKPKKILEKDLSLIKTPNTLREKVRNVLRDRNNDFNIQSPVITRNRTRLSKIEMTPVVNAENEKPKTTKVKTPKLRRIRFEKENVNPKIPAKLSTIPEQLNENDKTPRVPPVKKSVLQQIQENSPVGGNSSIPVLFENPHHSPLKSPVKTPQFLQSTPNKVADHSMTGKGYSTPLHSSFNDSINYCDISHSTPVKCRTFNGSSLNETDPKKFDVSNCFGFDEPEVVEEPIVSPIKPPSVKKVVRSCLKPPAEPKEEVPVSQVIKMLRFEVDDSGTLEPTETVQSDGSPTSSDSSGNAGFPSDHMQFTTSVYDPTLSTIVNEPSVYKTSRRSYERIIPKRKKIIVGNTLEDDSEIESEEEKEEKPVKSNKNKPTKTTKKKGKTGAKKKEDDELEEWAKKFNMQCQQIDGFNLVVE